MHDGWEILIASSLKQKALRLLRAMADAAPADTVVHEHYSGERRHLMLYGPGSDDHLPLVRRTRQRGGHVAMWDMGYWDRAGAMRLAIDTLHPTAAQLAMAPDGPGRRDFDLREDADPDGPILLVGLGQKSVQAYRLGGPHQWEHAKLQELRRRFPGRAVEFRPKGRRPVSLCGLPTRHGMEIADALRGCSLVVCRHSNVAVDACIAGVPVECEDGAAAALYAGGAAPTPAARADFLRRLSWWEWAPVDAADAWAWIRKVTG